jgi:hypothetical protein
MSEQLDRRDFVKVSAAAGVGAAALGVIGAGQAAAQQRRGAAQQQPQTSFFAAPKMEKVRVGFIGIGNQGSGHLSNLLKIENVEVKAICDVIESRVTRAQQRVVDAGQPKPAGYAQGEQDFVRMCETEDLDLVYNAAPWRFHTPIMLTAMNNGSHAATEVPAALTIDECWALVETAEKTKRHCVMMENCCYDRTELLTLNMVNKGLFGEILHAECGYRHDLRALKLSPTYYQGMWRVYHAIKRNADLYPTHGLGPVAQCMDINRGNKFEYLTSMSTQSRGLNLFAAEMEGEGYGPNSKWAQQKYELGDVVTTLIKTNRGQSIVVTHDTDTPRPYSRDYLVQGTKGLIMKYPIEQVAFDHTWKPLADYKEEHQHPLIDSLEKLAEGAGHGGMDFIEDFRLIHCLLNGLPTDMNVYDAAAISSVVHLSEMSINNKSQSVEVPDFTRGRWKTNPPLGIVTV